MDMTLTLEEAEEAAGAIGLIGAGVTLLWMLGNIGEMSTVQAVNGFESIVTSIAVPSFGLILLLLAASFVYSQRGF